MYTVSRGFLDKYGFQEKNVATEDYVFDTKDAAVRWMKHEQENFTYYWNLQVSEDKQKRSGIYAQLTREDEAGVVTVLDYSERMYGGSSC